MSNGTDSKYRSRKFIFAAGTFAVVTIMALHSEFKLAADSGDTALVIGAAGAIYALLLKLYNDANLEDKNV